MPRLPTLASIARAVTSRRTPRQTPNQAQRRTFQERPDVQRRGFLQPLIGPTALEARAAQDVPLSLPERIVLKELRRRMETVEFVPEYGQQINVGGWLVDFLITSRTPNIALDVYSDWDRPELNPDYHMNLIKGASLEAQGLRYAYIWDDDIYESALRLETIMDEILGVQLAFQSLPGQNTGVTALDVQVFAASDYIDPNLELEQDALLVSG